MSISRFSAIVAILSAASSVSFAQSVISAQSGTLHYTEGDVTIDGQTYQPQVSKFPEIKEQSVLATGLGRAEVLLTPGVFLRLGENTSIRMLDNRLVSTRVDVMSGSVTLESDDPMMSVQNSPVTLLYKDYEIHMVKHGLVELTSDTSEMKVIKGEAEVSTSSNRATVHEGHLLPFSAGLTTEKFDAKTGDDLLLWTRDRSGDLSAANMSSARSLNGGNSLTGYGPGLYGAGAASPWGGGWYYNQFFDMYTYVPASGTLFSPFGFGFYSPGSIYSYYTPGAYWYGGGAIGGQPLNTALGGSTKIAAPLASLRQTGSGRITPISSPLTAAAPATSGLSSAPVTGRGFGTSSLSSGSAGGGRIGAGMASSRGGRR